MVGYQIAKAVRRTLALFDIDDKPLPQSRVEYPTNPAFGDYSTNAAILLARKQQRNPQEIASLLVSKLNADQRLQEFVSKIEVAGGGFINFFVSENYLKTEVTIILKQSDSYGRSDEGKGKKWEIEHTSPNPNKAMHLGHLRNNITGMAIANLWEFTGVEVIRDCVDNNRGIAIAKLMWGYLKFSHKNNDQNKSLDYWFDHQEEWFTPDQQKMKPDRFVDEIYTKASKYIEEHKEVESEVRKLVVDWEKNDKKTWALWKKVLEYSYQGQERTLKRLGNRYDYIWHEHEHYQLGKDLVERGLAKGVFRRSPEGTIITDLSSYNLPDTVVQKSDGTSLYITQDLALTKLKKEKFNADKLHWVVGPEQSLALKQLFAVCEQLMVGRLSDFYHISFGYMSIKGQGKMSSRSGNVVYIDDLIDTAKAKVIEKMMNNSSINEAALQTIAEQIALGAIKYSILKVGREQDIAFDFDESINMQGNSGPYIQYTYARTQSVVAKGATVQYKSQTFTNYTLNTEERIIAVYLSRFADIIAMSAKMCSPSTLASYLFDLAQNYNAFYNKHTIIEEDNEVTTAFRLALSDASGQVLKNGLQLLGIAAPQRM
jgi:arginyl-tRNA synthetase